MNLQDQLKQYRLSEDEFQKICGLLGREPKGVEWALFSALWSEHCSYKSSKVHLKKFSYTNDSVLESFGENAGVIDLGHGERVAFKMESHNHPSFIEPYEGAATGVGGILRDIFTMGARPVALANYLCFGEKDAERMPSLVDGVVRGIGGYGNCVGVATVTGQTEFDKSYNQNILVNAFALGLFREGEQVFTSREAKPGHIVVYVGAKTGRDGVHGASMASESFDEDSEAKKPTIQKGDPFLEKLLIESCIEVMSLGLVESIQDMGAAGLTSSSFEMADKAGYGFEMHLDKVPLRDSTMTPEDILLSESQERMLLSCQPENFSQLKEVFHRWDLDAEVIGEVKDSANVDIYWKNELLTSIDPKILVDNAPEYDRSYKAWEPKNRVEEVESYDVKEFVKILEDVNGVKKNWVYDQYDQRVGGQTIMDCSQSVGAVRLKDSNRALGIALGCRPHLMRFDAKEGARDAIAYPALRLAAKGFKTLGVTDCLNFGNPEKVEPMSEFVAAVDALAEASEAFESPVISGNVSLYNETLNTNITPTPSTGLVGLKEDLADIPKDSFVERGSDVILLRLPMLHLNGRIFELRGEGVNGKGEIDVNLSSRFAEFIRKAVCNYKVKSSRVVGTFGLMMTIFKMSEDYQCSLNSELPFEIKQGLLQENLYEVVLEVDSSVAAMIKEDLKSHFADNEVQFVRLGKVVDLADKGGFFENEINELKTSFGRSLGGVIETLA